MLKLEFMSKMNGLYVKEVNGFKGLYAKNKFSKGEIVCIVEGEEISEPNRYSVQIDDHLHINVNEPVKFINHKCDGNITLEGFKFIANRAILPNQEICFNYLLNEEKLAESFKCFDCGQIIKGKSFIFEQPCNLSTV